MDAKVIVVEKFREAVEDIIQNILPQDRSLQVNEMLDKIWQGHALMNDKVQTLRSCFKEKEYFLEVMRDKLDEMNLINNNAALDKVFNDSCNCMFSFLDLAHDFIDMLQEYSDYSETIIENYKKYQSLVLENKHLQSNYYQD